MAGMVRADVARREHHNPQRQQGQYVERGLRSGHVLIEPTGRIHRLRAGIGQRWWCHFAHKGSLALASMPVHRTPTPRLPIGAQQRHHVVAYAVPTIVVALVLILTGASLRSVKLSQIA